MKSSRPSVVFRAERAFTIMELMVTVFIITLLVSLSTVGYLRYKDTAAMLVDETNEKVLLSAVKLYAYDTHALPGSLSQLRKEDLRRAYALVTEGKRPYTALAFLQEQVGLLDIADAAPLPSRYLGDNPRKILTCPSDKTPPALGGVSYGILNTWVNADGTGKPLSQLLDPANAGVAVIVESDVPVPTTADIAFRHNGGRTYVSAAASGTISKITVSGAKITVALEPVAQRGIRKRP